MTQISILLSASREDYVQAMNVLTMLRLGLTPYDISDVLLAYLVAKDWCYWLEHPDVSGNPLHNQKTDYTDILKAFQDYVRELEKQLADKEPLVATLFNTLNSNLLALCHDSSRRDIQAQTKTYIASLRVTAEYFEKVLGKPQYADTLRKKL